MVQPLSTLGIVHTAISLLPALLGVVAFVRWGRIDVRSRTGVAYAVTLALSVVTSLGLSSTGGLNAGHALGGVALLALAAAWVAPRIGALGRWGGRIALLAPTASYFLLWVPGINETLSRVPLGGAPLGQGPDSPVVQAALGAALLLMAAGCAWQLWRARKPV